MSGRSVSIFFVVLSSVIFVPVRAQTFPATGQGTLTVTVSGLSSDRGTVKIALSNSRENYYDYPSPYRGASAPILGGIAVWTFEGLPYGEYAVKVFHDENGNDRLDTNLLGIPREDYGFSNDARGIFGVPSWPVPMNLPGVVPVSRRHVSAD